MTGFNLPPGCSVNDLPGNDPAAEEREDLLDKLTAVLPVLGERFNNVYIGNVIHEALNERVYNREEYDRLVENSVSALEKIVDDAMEQLAQNVHRGERR